MFLVFVFRRMEANPSVNSVDCVKLEGLDGRSRMGLVAGLEGRSRIGLVGLLS